MSWNGLEQCDVTGDQLTCPRVREGLDQSKSLLLCSNDDDEDDDAVTFVQLINSSTSTEVKTI